MHYLLDDELRNRGDLTLVSPYYVKHLSCILKLAHDTTAQHYVEYNDSVPKRGHDTQWNEKKMEASVVNHIDEVCKECKKILPNSKLITHNQSFLLWNLITRIFNANIGKMVKQYRQDKLNRVNDVSFRKGVDVKCESTTI